MRCCRSSCSASPSSASGCNGSDRLEQLRQRVIAIHHLDPMERRRGRPLYRRTGCRSSAGRAVPISPTTRSTRCIAGRTACRAGSTSWPARVMLHGAIEQIDADRRPRWSMLVARRHRRATCRVAALPVPAEPRADRAAPLPMRGRSPTDQRRSPIASPRLEARLEEQDAALRRVLTLLVDWVEGDARGRDCAAAARPDAGVSAHAATACRSTSRNGSRSARSSA